MTEGLPFTSLLETARALRRREVSPTEVLDLCLARGEEIDAEVGAVVWRNDLTGRTNVSEIGALLVAENERYGITRNPWLLSRTSGDGALFR